MKDPLGLSTLGAYRIPSICGKSYIGQTGHTIELRSIEHKRCLRLAYREKSALADHGWETGHTILFDQAAVLFQSDQWGEHLVTEALEICLEPEVINKDSMMTLSSVWLPMLNLNQQGEETTLMKQD